MFDTERCCQNGVCKDYFDTNYILICIGLRNSLFRIHRDFPDVRVGKGVQNGIRWTMDTSLLGLLPFFQFFDEKVGSPNCLTYDGAY